MTMSNKGASTYANGTASRTLNFIQEGMTRPKER
jgi:hypothetical protein